MNTASARRLLVVVILSGLLFACATSEGALFETIVETESTEDSEPPETDKEPDSTAEKTTESDRVGSSSDSVEPDPEEPEYGIRITASPGSASLFVNGSLVGTGSAFITPDAGSYQITARKSGYYTKSVWVNYAEETLVVVDIDLDEITGYLYVEVTPRGAEITANGYQISEGVTELQIGSYAVRVRLFGYEEWRGTAAIRERQTTRVEVVLEEATFRLSDLSVSRKRFSPLNPGKLGTTRVSFEVNTWGQGRLVVQDVQGREIFSKPLPRFTTWEQAAEWDGRDEFGAEVPDGEYRIGIVGSGEGDTKSESLWTTVSVDSAARISYRSFLSGLSGTLFAPTPEVLPAGSFQIDFGAMGHYDVSTGSGRYPAYLAARVGLGGRSELDFQGGIFINAADTTPYTAGVGFTYVLPESDNPLIFGVNSKLTYVGNTTIDTFTNYTGLYVGATAGLQAGPVTFAISPEVVVSPYAVSYTGGAPVASLYFWLYGRAAVLADFGSITAGLSAAARSVPFSYGFGIDLPFSAGAEIHWLLPGTQIVLSGFAAGEFAAADNFYLMGGGGISIIN
jgi:hypothetical protein